jgi:hypothetical protein
MAYNFHAKECVAAPASFNEDYVAAARHMNPYFVGRQSRFDQSERQFGVFNRVSD